MSRLLFPGTATLCPSNPPCFVELDVPADVRSAVLQERGGVSTYRPEGRATNGPSNGYSEAHGRQHEQRYVSRRELRRLFPVSDMTVFRWMRDSRVAFPRPVKLGPSGRNFWWLPAILEWERLRAANSFS